MNAINYEIDIDRGVFCSYDANGNLRSDLSELIYIIDWNNAVKMKQVQKTGAGLEINFNYDPFGNRISKQLVNTGSSDTSTTFYVHDATGNIMAIYESSDNDSLKMDELDIYGSSRLGVLRTDNLTNCIGYSFTENITSSNWVGKKLYELTNHLRERIGYNYG